MKCAFYKVFDSKKTLRAARRDQGPFIKKSLDVKSEC